MSSILASRGRSEVSIHPCRAHRGTRAAFSVRRVRRARRRSAPCCRADGRKPRLLFDPVRTAPAIQLPQHVFRATVPGGAAWNLLAAPTRPAGGRADEGRNLSLALTCIVALQRHLPDPLVGRTVTLASAGAGGQLRRLFKDETRPAIPQMVRHAAGTARSSCRARSAHARARTTHRL